MKVAAKRAIGFVSVHLTVRLTKTTIDRYQNCGITGPYNRQINIATQQCYKSSGLRTLHGQPRGLDTIPQRQLGNNIYVIDYTTKTIPFSFSHSHRVVSMHLHQQ